VSEKRIVKPPPSPPPLARFLLDQLFEAGVDTVFGIPGDFILALCQEIDRDPRISLRTMSHEPGVGFAASGAARGPQGLGVACVTYGAGALNMVNPVAAAYAEKTPLVVITGSPGRGERERGILVHHQVKTFDSQLKVFREVTHYQAVLDDPASAAEQIREAIDLCRAYSLPVYLEVPRDMVSRPIEPGRARKLDLPVDEGALEEASFEILERVQAARSPVLVVGVEVQRQGLSARVVELAERLGIAVVTTFMGRGTFPDDHAQYAGTYLGPASRQGVRKLVEESDCLFLLGALVSDTNMGVRLTELDPRRLIVAVSRRVEVGHHHYQQVPLDALVESLVRRRDAAEDGKGGRFPGRHPFMRADDEPSPGPIRVASMIAEINRFFAASGEMPLVTDTGDCMFCAHEIDTQLVLASAYYATMGFGVPAAMGWSATGGGRPLVLVGDGGFQMTGWELLHARRWGVAPIVMVMNNRSWEMLQSFLPSNYNRLDDGEYAELAKLWGGAGLLVGSAAELREALASARANESWSLIEVTLSPGDISATLDAFTRSVGTTPPPPAK